MKEATIDHILQRVSSTYQNANEVVQVKSFIKEKFYKSPSSMHDLYGETFNLVDKTDRKW